MTSYAEFTNPNLVAIYDTVNPIGSYAGFYLSLVKGLGAQKIIDLGCGTGLLSHELALHNYGVIGVEPAPAMLEQARQKYGNEAEWIIGGAEQLKPGMQADLLIMTGHVAQFFLDDEAWQQALQYIRQALKPGGYVAFESRNPAVQPFTSWPTKQNPTNIPDTPLGPVEWWHEGLTYRDDYAKYDIHYLFTDTGEELVSNNTLRFRSQDEIAQSLQAAGLTVEHVYGDWDSSPLQAHDHEMIFVARKA